MDKLTKIYSENLGFSQWSDSSGASGYCVDGKCVTTFLPDTIHFKNDNSWFSIIKRMKLQEAQKLQAIKYGRIK